MHIDMCMCMQRKVRSARRCSACLMAFQSKLLTGFSFTILVLSWAATNFYPPCPAFTNLLSIRTDAPQLTVYAALSTNFPKFPQPPRHCLTRPATRPRHASSASRSSRVFSPLRLYTRPPRPRSLQPPRPPPTCWRRPRTCSAGRPPTWPAQLPSLSAACLRCRALLAPPASPAAHGQCISAIPSTTRPTGSTGWT